ncbi:hypothetical protein ACX0HA_16810 [Flavobacterium hauense]
MKNLLTLLLLVLGTSAFANTEKNTEPKSSAEGHETTITKKTAAKTAKVQEAAIKPAATTASQKEYHTNGTSKACTTAEKSAFGITGYFVDFVHRSNVKLVNMLID